MEARIFVLQLCSVDPAKKGLRLTARKACLVRRLPGSVFFVGSYRSGLDENASSSWKVLQVVLQQLFGSSSRNSTYSLFIKLKSGDLLRPDSDQVRSVDLLVNTRPSDADSAPREGEKVDFVKVRSLADIFSICSSTAVELLVVDSLADAKLVQVLERASVSVKRDQQVVRPGVLPVFGDNQPGHVTAKQVSVDKTGFLLSRTDEMLSRGKHFDSSLPSATTSRTAQSRYSVKTEADVSQVRCQWSSEIQRTVGTPRLRQQRMSPLSQRTLPTGDAWKHQTSATVACDKRSQVRNFVTVEYRSNRRSLRGNRSFREKKVQRHRVPAEMSAILSMFEQGGTGGTPANAQGPDGKLGVIQVPELDAPSGLTITTQSEQSVHLLWNPVSLDANDCNNGHHVIGYTVYLNGQTEALIEDTTNCQVELFELQGGTTYHITVKTRTDTSESLPSETLRYTHRLGLHQLSSMAGQSCKALSRSLPVLPQCPSPAELRKVTPASPSPLCYTPGECSSDNWRRSVSSSSSGIGTDSCPSPSSERPWTQSCLDVTQSNGWIDESFDDVRRLFLDHQDKRYTSSHKMAAGLSSRRHHSSRSCRQQSALASRARDLYWDSHFDVISGLGPVEALPQKVTYYCSSV